MSKVKMIEIANMKEALSKLNEMPLSISVSMKIMKITSELEKELVIFETQKNKLFKQLGQLTEDKTQYEIKDEENKKKFTKEMETLLNYEVEINSSKIKIEELKDYEGKEIFISPKDLYKLKAIIED